MYCVPLSCPFILPLYLAYGNGAPATGFPFKYTGRRLDPETGLYYYRARYLSTALGRFLQTDPIGYGDQMNAYAYVGNDPGNATDPTGEETCTTNSNGTQTCERKITTSIAGAIVAQTGAAIWNTGVQIDAATRSNSGKNKQQTNSVAKADSGTRSKNPYVVRVQIQGGGLKEEISTPISSDKPIKADLVNASLANLFQSLPTKDQAKTAVAVKKAMSFVERAKQGGGVPPIGSQSFLNGSDPGSQYRVDIEVLSGEVNLVK